MADSRRGAPLVNHCVRQQQCRPRGPATGPAVNRLPQTPTTIEDHPIGSQPKRRSVEKRLLEPRIVGNQDSARLARSSEPVFDIGCQLITCRTVETAPAIGRG